VAVKLIYQAYAKLLSGMVLHARSETANEIKILALRPHPAPAAPTPATRHDVGKTIKTRPNHHRTTTMDRRRIS
jgi:hypothetical protein